MQISNIQENLSKTELVQRLQQIMQDAARASQAVHTTAGDERSRVAMEQVEDSQQSENEGIREDENRSQEGQSGRRRRKDAERESDTPAVIDHSAPSAEGRIIDVTV